MIKIKTLAQPDSSALNKGEAELKIELFWNGKLKKEDLEKAKKSIRSFIKTL